MGGRGGEEGGAAVASVVSSCRPASGQCFHAACPPADHSCLPIWPRRVQKMLARLRGAQGTKVSDVSAPLGLSFLSRRAAVQQKPVAPECPSLRLIDSLPSTVAHLLPVFLFLPKVQSSGLGLNKGWRGGLNPRLSANLEGLLLSDLAHTIPCPLPGRWGRLIRAT